jgi:hypothetical protein
MALRDATPYIATKGSEGSSSRFGGAGEVQLMTTTTACRRKARRHRLSSTEASVEFDYPNPGGHPCRLPLVDVSISGLSFAGTDELFGIEAGTDLSDVTIRVGSCEMRGDLLVMHATPEGVPDAVYGALFYPASDTDLVKMKSVLAGIEAVEAPAASGARGSGSR